jgi:hypothetical protein
MSRFKTIQTLKPVRALAATTLSFTLLLSACDLSTNPGLEARSITLDGRVTSEAGYGKAGSDVDGATVTAASVTAGGNLAVHSQETQTNAQGHFELGVTAESDVLVVMASRTDFEARALVDLAGHTGNRVRVMPLTAESTVEADVFVESHEQGHDDVTSADVALHVNADAAAQVRSGSSTTAALAAAVASVVRASNEFVVRAGANTAADLETARDRQRTAFARLHADLYAGADAASERAALDAFFEAVVEAWTDAGIDISTQAKARAAGAATVLNLATNLHSATRLEVRRQAMYVAALARSLAVEAELRADGASDATLASLAEAQAQMLAEIRAAGSANALDQAWARFRAEAEAGLAATTDLTQAQIASAVSALQTVRTALETSLSLAGSAEAVADAYVAFDVAADAALTSNLNGSADVNTAATVLLILSL